METKISRPYSHSSLSLWHLCHRRWWHHYVRGYEEPTTINMAFSKWLFHSPIEQRMDMGANPAVDWEVLWEGWNANFMAEAGIIRGDDLFNVEIARSAFRDLLDDTPFLRWKIHHIEEPFIINLINGQRYMSIPDFVVEDDLGLATVDLKFATTYEWSPTAHLAKYPLRPYDDQLLGQAICAEASRFLRISTIINKKDGKLYPPIIEEQHVDPLLKEEWLSDTIATIDDIESWKRKVRTPWPKLEQGCMAFGRPCPHVADCGLGFMA
jgi:hypothetical protein